MLKIICEESGNEWDDMIPYVELATRGTQITNSIFSPAEIIFGKQINNAYNHLINKNNKIYGCCETYVREINEKLKYIHDVMREDIRKKHTKLESSTKVKKEFEIGNNVLVKCHLNDAGYKYDGPFKIEYIVGPNCYKIKNMVTGKYLVRNGCYLKRFQNSPISKSFRTSIKTVKSNETDPATRRNEEVINDEARNNSEFNDGDNARYPKRERQKTDRFINSKYTGR